jgi:hypothetical protein
MVVSLGGLPSDDIQKMLGGNALGVYDIDAQALWSISKRIGPRREMFIRHAAE